MSNIKEMLKYFKICVLVLVAQLAFAGNNNSVFEGNVSDKKTGENIAGAKVTVKETGTVVYTDFDGQFAIENLEPGTYTFEISVLGYDEMIIQKYEISNKRAEAKITLAGK